MTDRLDIAVDARTAYDPHRRGTGKSLVDMYRAITELRPQWSVQMLHRRDSVEDPFAEVPSISARRIEMPGDRWNLWGELRLPWAARGEDVLHCPANLAPRWTPTPMVVTVHDLIPLDAAEPTPAVRAWGRSVARSVRRARRVVTPSEYTRRRLVEVFGVDAHKVTVNAWAADAKYAPVTDPDRLEHVRQAYGLEPGRRYVFAFSGADPRKNAAGIVSAYRAMPKALQEDVALLMVGLREPLLSELRRLASQDPIPVCRFHGFAEENDIPALLSGADLLCYPTFSEGFGLPVLEAFACGTAVVAGNVTSVPEVAGDAARLVDPRNTDAIRQAMQDLLEDDAARTKLARRGQERARSFTWQDCARRMIEVLETVAEK